MPKHIAQECLYEMPSGARVHPCRLIVKDGTLMWKHAFLNHNEFTSLPLNQAHEQHIIKTAQRLEELNVWVSQDLEPWQALQPIAWYDPKIWGLEEGISVYFKHAVHSAEHLYDVLSANIQPHETLKYVEKLFPEPSYLFFKRC